MWKSSNPALANDDLFSQYYGETAAARPETATLAGVVNKTGLLVSIAIVTGAIGYAISTNFPPAMWIAFITALVVTIGVFIAIRGNPARSPIVAPIYAIVEGFFLGALTCVADQILLQQGIKVAGGVGVQAFIITCCAMVSMLILYKTGLIKPTKRFAAVLSVATAGIALAYLVSFILSIFWQPLPLISFASAVQDQGAMGFLGLGINVFILIIASLWLIIDFKMVEDVVDQGSPRYMEWYCGFALLVTLAWIYFEAVKLVVRLAVLFGNRD